MPLSDQGTAPARLTELDIAEVVCAYLVDSFLLGQGTIAPDASLLESGVVDSTGIVELATFLEVRFEIEVDDDDMTTANLDSVARIAAFVMRKRAPAGPGGPPIG
jgi:acyl carrier protein